MDELVLKLVVLLIWSVMVLASCKSPDKPDPPDLNDRPDPKAPPDAEIVQLRAALELEPPWRRQTQRADPTATSAATSGDGRTGITGGARFFSRGRRFRVFSAASAPVLNHRQRQQPARLVRIRRRLRKPPKRRPITVSPKRNPCSHGKPLCVYHDESQKADSEIPYVSPTQWRLE